MEVHFLKKYLLWAVSFSFIAGILFGVLLNPESSQVLAVSSVSFFVLVYLLFLSENHEKTLFFLSLITILFFCLGTLRYINSLPVENPALEKYLGESVEVQGTVKNDPSAGVKSQEVVIIAEKINGTQMDILSKVITFSESFPEYKYNDLVLIKGDVLKPEGFKTSSGREFDYASFLSKDKILYRVSFPDISLIERRETFLTKLYSIKHTFIKSIKRNIPNPEAGLLSGILVGDKKGLADEHKESFRKSGLIHIVVLSGYNITIVAEVFGKVFSRTSKFLRMSGSMSAIGLFVVMVAAGPAALRAGIMASLLLLTRAIGRTYLAGRALIFVVFLMLVYNPLSLIYDPGFQLSVLATAGLIYFSPYAEEKLKFFKTPNFIKDVLTASISAQIFVLPLIIFQSGELSLFTLPANILALPLIPPVMFSGFFSAFIGILSPLFASPFSLISYFILKYIFWVSSFFAELEVSVIKIPEFSMVVLLLLYLPHLLFIFYQRKFFKRKDSLSFENIKSLH